MAKLGEHAPASKPEPHPSSVLLWICFLAPGFVLGFLKEKKKCFVEAVTAPFVEALWQATLGKSRRTKP